MSETKPMVSQAIKDKLAELMILLDQENEAGRANIATSVVMFDVPDRGVQMLVSGCESKTHLWRMIKGLMMHMADMEPAGSDQILPPKDRVN